MRVKRILALTLAIMLALSTLAALAAEYTDSDTVTKVQQALNDAGYDCGTADGIAGKRTRSAISSYQADHELEDTGSIDDALLASLGLSGEASPDADEQALPAASFPMGGAVTGDFDEPALIDPEERYYEYFVEETDGSEYLVFVMLDTMNDEARDIEEHGALYITENQFLNKQGKPAVKAKLALQDSPFGRVLISEVQMLWTKVNTYSIGTYTFVYDGDAVETHDGKSQEDFDFYCESYHFPYGRLETLNGARQDENGYGYFFIKSEENLSFEFVVGEGMRILQLRLYTKNDDGHLALSSYVDYDVGPAWEIPQPVLDAMGQVLEPVSQ